MMWELIKDLLLVSLGMDIGVVLMCIMSVGKEADYEQHRPRCAGKFQKVFWKQTPYTRRIYL